MKALCEIADATKVQIWVTLIAYLLLMVMQIWVTRQWSFSGLATMVRIVLTYYVDFTVCSNNPEKAWEILLGKASDAPPEPSLFGRGGCNKKKQTLPPCNQQSPITLRPSIFIGQQ